MRKKSYEMDMCSGPILSKMLVFAIPLMLSSILQLLFNAADIVVVGRFAGSNALAAVGSTSSLINLLVSVFNGLSIGVNVLVARYLGARDAQNTRETVHTAVLVSIVSGLILVVLGISLAAPLLSLMGTPDDVLPLSTLYIRIYFGGMPFTMLYNFGSAIMRSTGDTKRPLYFLAFAGVVNVVLNLILVVFFNMSVAGVAIATVVSQAISAILVMICLLRMDGLCRVDIKQLRIYKDKLVSMIRIGLPAGLQGALFNISNVLIQSSVNSFGSVAMAGNSASANIEGFIYMGMNAIYQTVLSFISQNLGAKQYKRITRVAVTGVSLVAIIGVALGGLALLFDAPLLSIYSDTAEVVEFGLKRMWIIAPTYFICGMMDVIMGCNRGLGYSIMPMIVSLAGACGFRILWIFTVFATNPTLETLYTSYPISWALTAAAHAVCFVIVKRKLDRSAKVETIEA